MLLLSISRNFLQTLSLDDILSGNFHGQFNYFSRRLLLIDHYADCGLTTMRMISEIKTLLVRIKKILVSVSPTLYYANQFTQNGMRIIPWFI